MFDLIPVLYRTGKAHKAHSGSCRCGPCRFRAVMVRFPPFPERYTRSRQVRLPGSGVRPYHVPDRRAGRPRRAQKRTRALQPGPSACRKSLFDKLPAFFRTLKSSEKRLIENERHPSWVSFVAIFLPVSQNFRVDRQTEDPGCKARVLSVFFDCAAWRLTPAPARSGPPASCGPGLPRQSAWSAGDCRPPR